MTSNIMAGGEEDGSEEDVEIPFEKIELATNNFADENLIAGRGFPEIFREMSFSKKIYRGQLMKPEQKIDIVVWKCELMNEDWLWYFMSEKMKLCLLEHKNIKSILHYSYDEENRTTLVLVNKVEPNESLAEHLPGSTLTWKQRLGICIGVAEALKYVHNLDVAKPGHYLIHGNIKSSKILLDENWQPKLQGFESAMVAERNTLYVPSNYKGTLQYKDPEYEKTGSLTDKSDVFSFGVVLFEVLFGRKAAASTPNEQKDNWNFAEFARLHCKNKTLDKMIDPDLLKDMDTESIEIFSDVAYICLTELRRERPIMDQVVRELELSLELQKNHERSMGLVTETSSKDLQGGSFEHLMIPLKDILSATENFHPKYKIGSGGFATVYKAKLEHLDSIVAIKRISSTLDGRGEKGFIAEVQMLSNCRHPNIVSLLGFCDEGPQKILIYEYVPNGSLDGYLERSYRMANLSWGHRIQICLDIAHGLDYLHSGLNGNEIVIHRDIKSANILLDDNLRAKIADFGLSRLYTIHSKNSTINTRNLAGTEFYCDPEYMETSKLKKASDIYSFGVVLSEILCGKLAYDRIYTAETKRGLPSIARRLFKEKKLKTIVDRSIKETDGSIFSHNRVADQHSLDTFINIANQCLAETQDERPTTEKVIKELEKALNFQKNNRENLQVLLEDINLATQNFSDCNCIGEGEFWKLYKGDAPQAKGCNAIVAKRWNKSAQGHQQFSRELEFVFKHKHENVIDLVGYCTEMEEKIIVYEHLSKGSLDKYLKDISLSWMERLKICIDIASGLEFLHSSVMMHGDIKSGSVLIDGNRKAKISNLEFLHPSIVERVSKESDIYSLGLLLFEVLSGRLAKEEGSLGPLAIRWCRDGKLDEMVFEGIKDQIDPFSFDVFTSTACSCFKTTWPGQPNASDVLRGLKEALKFQIDIEYIPKTALKDIKLGSDDKCIQEGRYWKLYDAQVQQANAKEWTTVFAKRWDNKSRQAHALFLAELRNLLQYKNKHIVALVGYCNEMNEKIILYEHASNGSLDKNLDDPSFTWKKRLNICIDVASGWQFLHKHCRRRVSSGKHKAIKSSSIVIDGDWKGKIANLEYYSHIWLNDLWSSLACPVALGPTESVDVYALGVVLLEILCGRLAWPEGCEDHSQSLGPLAQQHYKEKGNLNELVFKGIKEKIHPGSLILFQRIALKCLVNDKGWLELDVRKLEKVESKLREALEVQECLEAIPQLSLEDIKQGTQNFSDDKCVAKGKCWKLYEGEFPDANAERYTTALVKRWDNKSHEARNEFLAECGVLSQYENDNDIVGIEGYCNEMDEKIIVYEHGCNRSLDKHLDDACLSWTKRLNICCDIAQVVNSLHYDGIGLRDIKSGSILIDSDWKGKVYNLKSGLSRGGYYPLAENDRIHELGVVLLEILCGRLAWPQGCEDHSQSLGPLAKRHYDDKGNFDELVFEGIKEQIAPESLIEYQLIAWKCISADKDDRWLVRWVVKPLRKALELQRYVEESPQISLEDIKLATKNFSDEKCIGEGRYWKLYEGEFPDANANGYTSTALVKLWDSKSSKGRTQFFRELEIHFRYRKNQNIIAVKGYCSEKDEKVIVFEHGYNRSLDKHLDDTSLSWTKRLNICINVASVLDFIHNDDTRGPASMIHGDIKSGSILIDGDWNAKVSSFEVFAQDGDRVTDNKAHSSLEYSDPQHQGSGMYKDIYSLGAVLLEMLCGRLAWPEGCEDHSQSLGPLAKRHYDKNENLDELVFEGIKEQIAPESLIAYQAIALKCMSADRDYCWLVGHEVVKPLRKALELQEDYERWNSKLPKEYKEYIKMSKTPERYSTEVKDLHDMLTKGILLQQDQLLFTLGANGERNEMISSTNFAYKNRPLRIWQSIPESRFQKVAQMLDISNLKIQIRVKTQFLSPGVDYGVYLVFKICGSRKSIAKRVYVNLSYKRGKDNLHAYFATWRDDEWMMTELCRFSNDKKDVDFEAILKSFSRCYCASRIIYVEGIEFRAIDKVNYVQQVLKSSSHIDEVQQSPTKGHEIFKISRNDEDDKMFSVNKVNGKKHFTLTPMEFLNDSSNVKPFDWNPSSVKRSQEVEFLPQQVLGIKCKIEGQMLSPATNYMCYLVFKFSEKCNGLHGPVIIRDLLNWKNKETGVLYFRSQNPWNLHDTDWVPRERKDGLMEVTVWKFNSKSELRNDWVPMNLKLITYEGTMSGLIVCSLEIRPI